MINMRNVWVLDVKKVAYEMSGPFLKIGAPQADIDSIKLPENFTKTIFLLKVLTEIYYIVNTIFLLAFLDYIKAKHIKKTWMGNFDPLRRSNFNLSINNVILFTRFKIMLVISVTRKSFQSLSEKLVKEPPHPNCLRCFSVSAAHHWRYVFANSINTDYPFFIRL